MKPPFHLPFVRTPAPEHLPRDVVLPLADEAVIDERILGRLQRERVMRIVDIERQPIPRWYDHAVVWWAVIAVQVVAAGAIVRALGIGAGALRLVLVGALVVWSVVVDARYVSYRRAIDTAPAYDQR